MDSDLKKRIVIFIGSVVTAIALLLPTVFKGSFPASWISGPLSLGLDLSGGVYLVYRVKTEEAIKGKLLSIGTAAKSEFSQGEPKIALTRVQVNDSHQLELTLLSSRLEKEAQERISKNFSDISFVRKDELDGGAVKLVYAFSEGQNTSFKDGAIAGAIEVLRNRVDQFGVAEPLIQKVGSDRIELQMPGVSDIESVKRLVGSTAKLEFRLVLPPGSSDGVSLPDKNGIPVRVEDHAVMTGEVVSSARVHAETGQVEVHLSLNHEGDRTFGKITSENIGHELAIVLDGKVHSHPRINDAIYGGNAVISGGFKFDEARDLAKLLSSGALPAPLEVMSERTVGPTLGKESIVKGVQAIIGGFVFLSIFLLVYYKKSGALALVSLALNLFFLLACLALFKATLTLPGLAGLALSVGMAVDSNVIIFERIRDELRLGSSRDAAVHAGFDKAFSAILDSNLSTLFSGSILYMLGTGAIRGFAVTLCVGILTTLYCAVFVCRLGFDLLSLKGAKQGLSI